MSENLNSFLIDLASDPERMARFVANPSGELDRSPLTAYERAAVLGGDGAELRRALGASPLLAMGQVGRGKPAAAKTAPKGGKKKGTAKKSAGKKK
jgi:hypothetical protein